MANNARQLRFNSILQTNLDKIIIQGIRFNLKKLEQCSRNIEKYKNEKHQEDNLKREYMSGRQIIQHLELNLNELRNSYVAFSEIDKDKKYQNIISMLESEVTTRVNLFTNENKVINVVFTNSVQNSDETYNSVTENAINLGLQIQQESIKLNDTKERYHQVDSLNRDIQELNTIAANLANLVQEQQTAVNNIETNVSESADNINEGTTTLIKASAASLAPLTCAAVGGAVFGPVGAIVGFKLSTGLISALGASAVSYYTAKFVQNKNKERSLEDLESISKK